MASFIVKAACGETASPLKRKNTIYELSNSNRTLLPIDHLVSTVAPQPSTSYSKETLLTAGINNRIRRRCIVQARSNALDIFYPP